MNTRKSGTDRFDKALQDHSPEGVAILCSEPSKLMSVTLYLLFLILVGGVIWSFFGKADVIVKVNGKLAPETEVRRVYSPVEGELVDVFISEGMPVKKGDVIARVDSPIAVQAVLKTRNAEIRLMDAERKFRDYPTQKRIMENRLKLLQTQIETGEKIHAKKVEESIAKLAEENRLKLRKVRAKYAKAVRERDHAKKIWLKHQRLFKSPGEGGISASVVAEKKNDYLAKKADADLAETALGEFEINVSKESAKRKDAIQKQMENIMTFRVQHESLKAKIKQSKIAVTSALQAAKLEYKGSKRITFKDIDEDNFLKIKAPTSGVLAAVYLTQVGDKVESKKPIAGIAPNDANKILEIEINESDRGFLKEGMKVKAKINAFPYQKYGTIEGTLFEISPITTLNPQTKKYFYRGKIELQRLSVSVGKASFPLRYGMAGVAEIIVRKRRLIDLALDPLRKVVS